MRGSLFASVLALGPVVLGACGGGGAAPVDGSAAAIDAAATIDGGATGDAAAPDAAAPDAAVVAECVFGGGLADLMPPRFVRGAWTQLTSDVGLSTLRQAQLVRAMHASTHVDVTTAAEALAAADGNVINVQALRDDIAIRAYTIVEYGAGDSSYGAIFDDRDSVALVEIHDGDLVECLVPPQACIFGGLFDLEAVEGLVVNSTEVLTSAAGLDATGADQVLAAGQRWTEVADIDQLLATVTDGEIVRTTVTHAASARVFTFITYILGDHRFGVAFAAGTTTPAVEINDNVHEHCDAF